MFEKINQTNKTKIYTAVKLQHFWFCPKWAWENANYWFCQKWVWENANYTLKLFVLKMGMMHLHFEDISRLICLFSFSIKLGVKRCFFIKPCVQYCFLEFSGFFLQFTMYLQLNCVSLYRLLWSQKLRKENKILHAASNFGHKDQEVVIRGH